MGSRRFKDMSAGFTRQTKSFINFQPRANGDYTPRQLSMAAAFTIFCHAEIEVFLEGWASRFVEIAEVGWQNKKATKPLVHLCTFHEGRGPINYIPSKDIWSEPIIKSIRKHKAVISGNHGIKEANVCVLFSPIGFDTRAIDPILLADLSAFGTLRGHHAHNSHKAQVGTTFDPFDRRAKLVNLQTLLEVLDTQLLVYEATL